MRHVTTLTTVALLAFTLAACGSDDGEDSSTTEDGAVTDCEDGPPQLTVTDSGTEPREVMRFSPTVGNTAEMDMEMSTVTDITVDGESGPSQSGPPMTLGFVITVDDVTDDQIDMSFTYDKAETDDAELQDSLDNLNGLSGTLSTDRSGAFIDGEIAAGDDADADTESLIEQSERQLADLTVPLPAEPIGPEATWDVASSFESGGVTYCNQTTYTLASLDGDEYELAVETTQGTQPTTIEGGNGVSIDVVSGSGTGTGRSSGSLNSPIASSGSSETTTQTEMNVKQDSSEQSQEIEVTLELELRQRG